MFRGPEHSSSSLFLAAFPSCVVEILGQLGTHRRVPWWKHLEKIQRESPMQGQGYVVPRKRKQVKANQVQDKNRQQDGSRYTQSLVSAPTNIFHHPSRIYHPQCCILHWCDHIQSTALRRNLAWCGQEVTLGNHQWGGLMKQRVTVTERLGLWWTAVSFEPIVFS